jgi:hypothetical protein
MGDILQEGFGGGATNKPLKAGSVSSDTWKFVSEDAKTLVLAWPYEVIFSDRTKWRSGYKNHF